MCFSAVASFTAGGLLSVAGVTSLATVKEKRFLPFASIPLLFALQQFSEGFVWLSLENANYAEFQYYSVNIFLIFAQVVWPFFVPLSYLIMEPDPKRKKWLIGFTLIGLMVSAFLAASMYVNLPKASV